MMSREPGPGEVAIRTRGLNLWYGDFQALKDVDLEIRHGVITSEAGMSARPV